MSPKNIKRTQPGQTVIYLL